MKKIAIILGILALFATGKAQEIAFSELMTIKYVYVRSELRAKHLEKKFFKFGEERDYFSATYDGKKVYLLEIDGDIVLTDRLFDRHLLTRRLRRKLMEITYSL